MFKVTRYECINDARIACIDDALQELDRIREGFEREMAERPPSKVEKLAWWTMDHIQKLVDKVARPS